MEKQGVLNVQFSFLTLILRVSHKAIHIQLFLTMDKNEKKIIAEE